MAREAQNRHKMSQSSVESHKYRSHFLRLLRFSKKKKANCEIVVLLLLGPLGTSRHRKHKMEATLDMSTVHILLKIYKSSTNCFLRWLWCAYHQVDPCAAGVKPFRTTRMIIKVSRTVYDASQPVPSSVLGALRDAIRFRSMVAQLYENSGRGDSGHRGFVKRYVPAFHIH